MRLKVKGICLFNGGLARLLLLKLMLWTSNCFTYSVVDRPPDTCATSLALSFRLNLMSISAMKKGASIDIS